jgi:hypothetical protein
VRYAREGRYFSYAFWAGGDAPICCGDQYLHQRNASIVIVSSIKPNMKYDSTCEFAGGEHKFITVPSFVYYRRPEQRPATAIDHCLQTGYFVAQAPFDPGHLQRVCDGIANSPFSPPWAKSYYRTNG